MGQTPDDIRHEVESARARLGQDLNQLEYRMKSEFDWRVQFQRKPWAFVGAAFGLALLAGVMTGRRAAVRTRAYAAIRSR